MDALPSVRGVYRFRENWIARAVPTESEPIRAQLQRFAVTKIVFDDIGGVRTIYLEARGKMQLKILQLLDQRYWQ